MAAPVPGEGGLGRPAPAHCPRFLSPLWQREVDRNQELLTRIRQLQEREAEAEERMKEQLERHRRCRQSLDAAGQKLREKEDGLAAAGEVRARPGAAASCGAGLLRVPFPLLRRWFLRRPS